tara:strand:+ start:526 stop:705 length:180 start_codon:yes stop_codon:yes gene_type:complete
VAPVEVAALVVLHQAEAGEDPLAEALVVDSAEAAAPLKYLLMVRERLGKTTALAVSWLE